MAEDTSKVKVRIGSFRYLQEVPDPQQKDNTILVSKLARQGEEIEVLDRDLEKGERLEAFGEPPSDEEGGEGGEFDASTAEPDEIAAHIEESNLNVADTVALAGDDPDTAGKVLEAEEQLAEENGTDPRTGVVDRLEKIIGD